MNSNPVKGPPTSGAKARRQAEAIHPAWLAFIRHCRGLEFGEISTLKIQNGIPVMAEESRRKIKFT
jgi:hypothetical protein